MGSISSTLVKDVLGAVPVSALHCRSYAPVSLALYTEIKKGDDKLVSYLKIINAAAHTFESEI